MKRFFILLILQTASAFAADSICERVLSDLRTLKLNYLGESNRAEAVVLRDSYNKKIGELATKAGISAQELETAVSKINPQKTNANASTVSKSEDIQTIYTTEIETLFKTYPHYEELLEKAKEFSDFFLSKQQEIQMKENGVINDFLTSKQAWNNEELRNKYEQAIVLFVSLTSKFLTEDLIQKYKNDSLFVTEYYTPILFHSIERSDFVLAKTLINYLEVPTDEILFNFIATAYNRNSTKVSLDVIRFALSNLHIDTNKVDTNGRNILHELADYFDVSASKNPDINVFFLKLAEEILKINPDLLKQEDNYGLTPIFSTHGELLNLFIKFHSDLNHQSINGNTPLHFCIFSRGNYSKAPEITKTLLNAGANTSLKNREGLTPYGQAVKMRRNNIVEIFKTHGIHE